MEHVEKLRSLGACDGPGESIEYASQYDTAQEAWDACERSDWMIWLWHRVGPKDEGGRRTSARLAIACARTALVYLNGENDRAEASAILDGLDAWAQGGPDERAMLRGRAQDIRSKNWQAYYAADAAAYAAYTYAAYAYTAYANAAAANAAAARADASYAAASAVAYAVASDDDDETAAAAEAEAAANAAASADDRQNHRALMAAEIRKILPVCPI